MTLYTGDVSQSGGEYVSMWKKAVDYADQKNHNVISCLILGVGGGTAAGVIKSKYPASKITGVEIDPQMIKVAEKYFGLRKFKNFKLVNADAYKWVSKNKLKFDLIITDLFINDLNPDFSRTKEFLTIVRKLLKHNGLILFNGHYLNEDSGEFDKFKSICRKIFTEVTEIHQFPKNRILLLA